MKVDMPHIQKKGRLMFNYKTGFHHVLKELSENNAK